MFELEKVIQGCQKQKRKDQILLYKQYAPLLLGICLRYANDKSEAEDILQDSFLKIFKSIHEFKGTGSLESWMKKVVVNTAISNFHKEKKHYYHNEIETIKEIELPYTAPADKDLETAELMNLLKTMPEGYKMIFNLYAIEGYKHKEIAEKLQIDESTSKSQYLRAKNWLIREMKKLNWI